MLPERFNIEIVEAYDWVFAEVDTLDGNYDNQLNYWLIEGFKWRSIESFNNEKLNIWLNKSGKFNLNHDQWLFYLFELTGIKNHPFNSDRLFRILSRVTMAERDGFFQSHMRGYSGYDDNGVAQPITRLIDWAWQDGISKLTDSESARLCGQTLCWLLSSTNRELRDQVTKALVNLLQHQVDALLKLITTFCDNDDFYIQERLYAVVYGCALRTSMENLSQVAQSVYDKVFKDGNPPEHILLRDYARNTIEYALFRGVQLDVNVILIRPPYQSKLPIIFPTSDEVELKYEKNHNDPDYRQTYSDTSNQILHSVLEGDFSRYTISSKLSNFIPLKFSFNAELERFKSGLLRGGKSLLIKVKQFFEYHVKPDKERKRVYDGFKSNQVSEFWASMDYYFKYFEEKLRSILTEEQRLFLTKRSCHFGERNLN
ncbi:hypothetical protein [Dyadobacter sp. NIV53]|uniref:hypothetical protein n=1 Tax=Dyadobacter sp. NIV53 TaxID=2861765 RepID=UPI001C871E6F|nr:hypothetical protein [Dyadobacter sp. NIV53]